MKRKRRKQSTKPIRVERVYPGTREPSGIPVVPMTKEQLREMYPEPKRRRKKP